MAHLCPLCGHSCTCHDDLDIEVLNEPEELGFECDHFKICEEESFVDQEDIDNA